MVALDKQGFALLASSQNRQREYAALRAAGWEFDHYDRDGVAWYYNRFLRSVVSEDLPFLRTKREALGMLEQ
jgi:hypothetical protein